MDNGLNCWFSIRADNECFQFSSKSSPINNEETMLVTGEKITVIKTVACHYAEVTSDCTTVSWLAPSQFKLSLGGENREQY